MKTEEKLRRWKKLAQKRAQLLKAADAEMALNNQLVLAAPQPPAVNSIRLRNL